MDLLCPHCFKRVTVPDDRAGQTLPCPSCGKPFAAPSRGAGTFAPPPPAAAPHSPSPPPAPSTAITDRPPAPAPAPAEPKPEPPRPAPAPQGAYGHGLTLHLGLGTIIWVAPACLLLILLLSFFDWHFQDFGINLWRLAFSEYGSARFIAYVLFTLFIALPLSALSLVLEKGWIPLPPPAAEYLFLKGLLVASPLALGGLLLLSDFLEYNALLNQVNNPITLPMRLAARLHLVALIAAALDFWLHLRQSWKLPLPRVELRW